MTRAERLADCLLEACLFEAGESFLRVFGPDTPEQGYFYSSADPKLDFFKEERPQAQITNKQEYKQYLKFFLDKGYTFVERRGRQLFINSQEHPSRIGPAALKSVERSLQADPGMKATWIRPDRTKQVSTAGVLLFGQPDRMAAAPGQTSQMTQAVFGSLHSPEGEFNPVSKIDVPAIRRDMANKIAHVIKYPNGSFNVATPKGFVFSKDAIKSLEQNFGITPGTMVKWYNGDLTTGKNFPARVVIYGSAPGASGSPATTGAPAAAPTPATPAAPRTP